MVGERILPGTGGVTVPLSGVAESCELGGVGQPEQVHSMSGKQSA